MTFHPDWVNLDSSALAPGVIGHDLRRGLPFASDSFDAVYGSHVLEHLGPDAAMRLLDECLRVLRPGGIARIVVPDLEAIARLYLEALAAAEQGEAHAEFRYDWSMLELYDQSVRTVPGGRMASCLRRELGQREVGFIESRVGAEALQAARGIPSRQADLRGLLYRRGRAAALRLRLGLASFLAWLALGSEGPRALREGVFRRSGEVHQYMYDRYSLKRAMARAGFARIQVRTAGESAVPDFTRYGLEVRDGKALKPDSLYMEGHKPAAT